MQLASKTPTIACKNTCNCKQKDLQSQAKILWIAGKNTRNCKRYCYYTAGKSPPNCRLDCILHVKLTANCVLNYQWSRVFCMRFLPRRCKWIYLFLTVNCIRVSLHASLRMWNFPIFQVMQPRQKNYHLFQASNNGTPLRKKYNWLEMLIWSPCR